MEDDLTALENDIASQYEIEYEKLDDPNVGEGEKKTYSDLEVQQLNTFISKLSTGGLEELGNAITPFSQQQPETKKPVEKKIQTNGQKSKKKLNYFKTKLPICLPLLETIPFRFL